MHHSYHSTIFNIFSDGSGQNLLRYRFRSFILGRKDILLGHCAFRIDMRPQWRHPHPRPLAGSISLGVAGRFLDCRISASRCSCCSVLRLVSRRSRAFTQTEYIPLAIELGRLDRVVASSYLNLEPRYSAWRTPKLCSRQSRREVHNEFPLRLLNRY